MPHLPKFVLKLYTRKIFFNRQSVYISSLLVLQNSLKLLWNMLLKLLNNNSECVKPNLYKGTLRRLNKTKHSFLWKCLTIVVVLFQHFVIHCSKFRFFLFESTEFGFSKNLLFIKNPQDHSDGVALRQLAPHFPLNAKFYISVYKYLLSWNIWI